MDAKFLRTQFTEVELAVITNALEDHVDKLRHNDSNIIGQLYVGWDDVPAVAGDLRNLFGEAAGF